MVCWAVILSGADVTVIEMIMSSSKIKAFTIIEVLVATTLIGITLVVVMGVIRSVANADKKAASMETMQRLAAEKLDEYGVAVDSGTNGDNGDFTDKGYPNIKWMIDLTTTSDQYVDQATITVTSGSDTLTMSQLLFVRPASTTSTSSSTGSAAGR